MFDLITHQILLVGMGADEQFAGYSRHRTAFAARSWQGLLDEVGV
jgi:asparagine synthetase B (glutamine-hydrolysing)